MAAAQSETELRKQRVAYLVEVYKLYHGHINTQFNYFLIIAGLLFTAYVQSMSATAAISKAVPVSVAFFGAFMSFIGLRIHIRSRDMLDTIECGLSREEEVMFEKGGGFLTAPTPRRWLLGRHKTQFRVTVFEIWQIDAAGRLPFFDCV
jgi:hypothetical protein